MPWEILAGTLDQPSTTSAKPVSLWAGQWQWQRGQQGAEHPTPNCIWGVPHFALPSSRDPLALHSPTSRGGWRKQHMTQEHTQHPWGAREASIEQPQRHPQCVFFLLWLLMKFFVCLHHLHNRKQLTLHNACSKMLPIQLKPEVSFCFPENEGRSWF